MLTINNTEISHLPPTFAIIIHIPRPLRPCIWRPRVPYLMSSSPSSRVPKSQVPTHASRCPRLLVPVPLLYTARNFRDFPSNGKHPRTRLHSTLGRLLKNRRENKILMSTSGKCRFKKRKNSNRINILLLNRGWIWILDCSFYEWNIESTNKIIFSQLMNSLVR